MRTYTKAEIEAIDADLRNDLIDDFQRWMEMWEAQDRASRLRLRDESIASYSIEAIDDEYQRFVETEEARYASA